ncbi:MAG: hypothetical protein H0U92_09095 [Actinobacteria bacterium]|nr:hypothetical protein [Actinomycetota bacterium]
MPIEMLTSLPAAAATAGVDTGLHVLACATTEMWTPPAAGTVGALSAAPAYDCSKGQVLGALSLDGKSLVFELGRFLTDANRVLSIAIIPAQINAPIPAVPLPLPVNVPLPAPLMPPTFDITFKPITANAIEVLAVDPSNGDDELVVPPVEDVPVYDFSPVAAAFTLALPPPAPVVARQPAVAFPRRVARQVGAAVADAQQAERTIAASVFLLLCLWAWGVANRNASALGAPAGRPFRTLYDGSTDSIAPQRRAFGVMPRIGKPPPLR